jgi:D-sedoheptulose 7-phosphate isomerase
MNTFIDGYIKRLVSLLNNLDTFSIIEIIKTIDNIDGKIYIIGNGGSAATASHMVNDLGVGLARRDIKYLDIESLSDNSSVCTALANDIGYENIFSMQLKNKIKANDVLIAISCSGNSPNIINAVEYAKKVGSKIIGLTGFDGGQLKAMSDINFHVNTQNGDYGLVEDLHMILDHIIYTYFIEKNRKI